MSISKTRWSVAALSGLVLIAPAVMAGDAPGLPPPLPPPISTGPSPFPAPAPVPQAGPGTSQTPDLSAPDRLSAVQLKELVGPVALYPDVVLDSLLPASAVPLDVVQAARWLRQQGGKADHVPDDQGWDPSVLALLQFPDVVLWLDDNLPWLQRLGEALATQQADVLQAVQDFRRAAQAAGNLKSNEFQKVEEHLPPAPPPGAVPYEGAPAIADAPPVIVIQPAQPQIVYVPTYDPYVICEPVYVAPAYPLLSFGLGFACGSFGPWCCTSISWGWGCGSGYSYGFSPAWGYGYGAGWNTCGNTIHCHDRPRYCGGGIYAPSNGGYNVGYSGGRTWTASRQAFGPRGSNRLASTQTVRPTGPSWAGTGARQVRNTELSAPTLRPDSGRGRFGPGGLSSGGTGLATTTRTAPRVDGARRWGFGTETSGGAAATGSPRTAFGSPQAGGSSTALNQARRDAAVFGKSTDAGSAAAASGSAFSRSGPRTRSTPTDGAAKSSWSDFGKSFGSRTGRSPSTSGATAPSTFPRAEFGSGPAASSKSSGFPTERTRSASRTFPSWGGSKGNGVAIPAPAAQPAAPKTFSAPARSFFSGGNTGNAARSVPAPRARSSSEGSGWGFSRSSTARGSGSPDSFTAPSSGGKSGGHSNGRSHFGKK